MVNEWLIQSKIVEDILQYLPTVDHAHNSLLNMIEYLWVCLSVCVQYVGVSSSMSLIALSASLPLFYFTLLG